MAYSLPEWMTVKRHWIRLIQMADQLGGEMVVKPSSFEQQLEAGASKFKKFLLQDAPNNFSEFCKGKSLQDMPKRHLVFHSVKRMHKATSICNTGAATSKCFPRAARSF
uniref:Uncharacterized protein n=2 Tax=Brassica oleracea var. oleracea TaxID=109376 RepID=A0A0D3BB57_BRAOL